MAKLLIYGIYVADQETWAADEIAEIGRSIEHEVEQRWIALDVSGTGKCNTPHTFAVVRQRTPKFALLNEMLVGTEDFDYLAVVDDDIKLPPRFIDMYLAHVVRFRLALAQPALTLDSNISHMITAQMPGLVARRTRYVEIGPLFSVHRSAFDLILPFDEHSPMGWGLEYIWAKKITEAGLYMGIVDATPVGHTLRKTAAHYPADVARRDMRALLQANPHLSYSEACTIMEAYA